MAYNIMSSARRQVVGRHRRDGATLSAERQQCPGPPAKQDGFALILTIIVMVGLLMGALAAVQYVSGYLPVAATDQQRQAALAAAQAGVNDYLNRLNQDSNYWEDGSASSNVAMQTSPSWGWVQVAPGSPAYYHYSVDTSDMTNYQETDSATASWGTIYLTSTGKVGNVTRTIQVGLRQADFLSNLYLSNYNLVDPIIMAAAGFMTSAQAQACVEYGWTKNANGSYGPNTGSCGDMFNYWVTGNVTNGPVQSNDLYYLCGTPAFDDLVSSADPNNGQGGLPNDAPYWRDPAGCGNDHPSFLQGGAIGTTATVAFPSTPTFIEQYASLSANPQLGCLYYGPTWIKFSGSSMYVYSPDTPNAGTGECLSTTDSPTTALSLPANGVIYVANLPSGDTCTVNTPSWAEFGGTTGSGSSASCLGNAFVQGTASPQVAQDGLLDGQMTVAADNNIYLVAPAPSGATQPSTVASSTWGAESLSGGDVLGLAADNYILINHDTASGGLDTFGAMTFANKVTAPTIDAVLFSVNASLATTYFWQGGAMGNLTINGAIVSDFMDIEGEFGGGGNIVEGYNEIYNWDSRLAHVTPPFYIPPGINQWEQVTYSELPAQNG